MRQGTVEYGTVRGGAVRCGTVRYYAVGYGTVRCGAVRCGAMFRGPLCWVWRVKYSSFGRLFLLKSENLSDHAYVFLVVELIFILFRKGLCQQVL